MDVQINVRYKSFDSDINKEYVSILRECIFISKPDEWFLEGIQASLDVLYVAYDEYSKFNDNSAIMDGLTYEGCDELGECREDSEGCSLEEFEIYDKFGNEISELTLHEYKSILRNEKIEQITQ